MGSIAKEASITIGVDPHPGTHTASAVTEFGRQIDEITVINEQAGWKELMMWARQFSKRRWAIEGPNNRYARGVVANLKSGGEAIFPITPSQTARYRRRSAAGKDDEIDATNAACALLANEDLPVFRCMPYEAELKELTRGYQRIRKQITSNKMSAREQTLSAVKEALARAVEALEEAAKGLEREMERIVKNIAPEFLALRGVGPIVTATVLAEAGWIGRFKNQHHFASYAGAAPLKWSSGAQETVRVNFKGNRRLNWAAHIVALSRLRIDPKTQAYRDKKLAEGKTLREVFRLLKTYICREFYRVLSKAQA